MINIIYEALEEAKKIYRSLQEAKAQRVRKVRPKKLDRIQEVQEIYNEHLESIGKPQTISVKRIVDLNNKKKMPDMVKHCVIKVQKQIKSEGLEESFVGAHNICIATFNRHGLVSKTGTLTGRGKLREKFHKNSKLDEGRGKKNSTYAKFFNKIFKL